MATRIRTRAGPIGRAAVLVLAASTLSGCTNPFLAARAPTTPTTTGTPVTVPPPNIAQAGQAPALTVAKTDPWAVVVPSLIQYVQWLLANPGTGQTLLSNAAVPGCSGYDQVNTQLSALIGGASLVSPVTPLLISITGGAATTSTLPAGGIEVSTSAEVMLTVKAVRGVEQVVNSSGQVVSNVRALPPTAFDVGLVIGGDGNWRLCTVGPADISAGHPTRATIW
jgi:hypothetical protein